MFVLRATRALAAPSRRLLSTSTGARSAQSLAPYILAGSGAALGAAALAASGIVGSGAEAAAAASASSPDSAAVSTTKALEQRLAQLEVAFAGSKQMALVFIKPHACNPEVVALVRAKLAKAGIRVTSEGQIGAAQIDKEMLIDNHYGAIAAKAVKLNPAELNVPARGKADFKRMFGLSWEEALHKEMVYNAADATAKLGGNGAELEKRWSGLNRTLDLLKFGGGFYVGRLAPDVYVINGFYAAMRSAYVARRVALRVSPCALRRAAQCDEIPSASRAIRRLTSRRLACVRGSIRHPSPCSWHASRLRSYTTPPAQLHYFTVQWPTESLSWADFRSEVLGATNPSDAAPGSVRREILEKWEALGLASKPNVGENGVHASASPFEALSERINWTGVALADDTFGRGMLAAGVPAATIATWTEDPQVTIDGKKGSLFDFLEDRDADDVLSVITKIEAAQ
jgi:nucleoside diphosphate kinase